MIPPEGTSSTLWSWVIEGRYCQWLYNCSVYENEKKGFRCYNSPTNGSMGMQEALACSLTYVYHFSWQEVAMRKSHINIICEKELLSKYYLVCFKQPILIIFLLLKKSLQSKLIAKCRFFLWCLCSYKYCALLGQNKTKWTKQIWMRKSLFVWSRTKWVTCNNNWWEILTLMIMDN